MFGALKDKLTRSAGKAVNKNVMEGIVAASLLVAAADGSVSAEETDKMSKLLANNDLLKPFGAAEIGKVAGRFQALLEADFNVGKMKALREIREVAGNPEHCEEIFVHALAIATADGTVDDGEKKVLQQIGKELGINLRDYDLA